VKEYKICTVQVEREVLIKVLCDRCGTEIPSVSGYDIRSFYLEFSTGARYPDGGYEEGWQVEDLSDGCVEILRRTLEKQNYAVTKLQRDW